MEKLWTQNVITQEWNFALVPLLLQQVFQNKTYVPKGTLRPRALLSIFIGVEFPGLTARGLAGTCSLAKT